MPGPEPAKNKTACKNNRFFKLVMGSREERAESVRHPCAAGNSPQAILARRGAARASAWEAASAPVARIAPRGQPGTTRGCNTAGRQRAGNADVPHGGPTAHPGGTVLLLAAPRGSGRAAG